MGRFEDSISISGKTYTHTNQTEKVCQAKENQPMATSKASWRKQSNPNLKRNEGKPYLDENGNPIKEEIEKIILSRK
jgi:hypothetical protein